MTNALAQLNNSLTMWEDNQKIEEIRKLFAPKLTESEFQYFVSLGRAAGLNPFFRELWAVKYDECSPAQVFIGRDGYRKAAQAHSEYDYHQCDAVYENDVFEVQDGMVKHAYKLTQRGALIGAYCIAKRHKSSRPMYVFVEVKEYSTGKSVWVKKPATMIKKVAESQCLRACFQDLLGGTYGEEEMPQQMDNNNIRVINGETQTERLKNLLQTTESVIIDGKEVSSVGGIDVIAKSGSSHYEEGGADMLNPYDQKNKTIIDVYASQDDLNKIEILMTEQKFDDDRKNRAFEYFKIKKLADLTDENAKRFLLYLGDK